MINEIKYEIGISQPTPNGQSLVQIERIFTVPSKMLDLLEAGREFHIEDMIVYKAGEDYCVSSNGQDIQVDFNTAIDLVSNYQAKD